MEVKSENAEAAPKPENEQLKKLVSDIKWMLHAKSKSEIIGLVTELFIKYEILKLENDKLKLPKQQEGAKND